MLQYQLRSPGVFLVLVAIPAVLSTFAVTSAVTDETRLKSSSDKLSRRLIDLVTKTSGYDVLQESYNQAAATNLTFERVDGEEIVKTSAEKLGEIFGKKIKALKEAAEHAEKLARNYKWNDKMGGSSNLDLPTYVPARDDKEAKDNASHITYEYNKQYRTSVSFENSSVHIPVDIYNKEVKILNTLTWTSDMDDVWRRNKNEDQSLSWQYFGSQTGVLRTFPASKWKVDSTPDLYDVRRRPWYTQGASSPKEMLILVDTSGSCHGQALALMKHSITSILDTLSENDFVNVANFSGEASLVAAGCFDKFVQATPRNKKKLIKYVETLHANGVANYVAGFEFAFKQFEEYNSSSPNRTEGEGAMCNQIIMFLTDGGTEKPEELFQKKNPDKRIRIFSYAVGPIANPKAAVKWIGCYNRGFFYEIPSMGAIRSTVQEHLVYLANPQIPELDVHTWTSVYLDKLGLGLVTSGTIPVFNRSAEIGNQTLLGVVGVDVPISELTDVIPIKKLGHHGYAFIINPNGNVVYHPNLKTDGEYTEPPSIDIVELEEETTETLQIRKDMIDQLTGDLVIHSYTVGQDDHHADIRSRHYYYTGIPNSNFRSLNGRLSLAYCIPPLAIVLPDYTKLAVSRKMNRSVDEDSLKRLSGSSSAILTDLDKHCDAIERVSNFSTPMEDLIAYLNENASLCQNENLQQLLFDLHVTSDVDALWSANENVNSEKGVVATMVEILPSFVRLHPPNASEYLGVERLKKLRPHILRTLDMGKPKWMFTSTDLGYSHWNITGGRAIVASKAVAVNNTNLAVISVGLNQQSMRDVLMEAVDSCLHSTKYNCYVVDDGGFVVFTNDRSSAPAGKFFGAPDVEPQIMADLVNKSVFTHRISYNYQATCFPAPIKTSSGPRLLPPLFYEMLSLNWWTATSTWTYTTLINFYTWLATRDSFAYATDDEAEMPHAKGMQCVKMLHQYHHSGNGSTFSGSVQCTVDCSRSYVMSHVADTNLFLFWVHDRNNCSGRCDVELYSPLPHKPEETEDPQFLSTPCAGNVRYRKRPQCYEDPPSENESHCSGCSWTVSPRDVFFCVLAAILSLRRTTYS